MDRPLSLPSFFSSGMVVQRRRPIRLWGWSSPGAGVDVSMGDARVHARARSDGGWHAELPALEAGGPHTIAVTAGDHSITLSDVLVGEVWICSGQSNMEMLVREIGPFIPTDGATYANLRLYTVPRSEQMEPVPTITTGAWAVATPETILKFSAVAFFFGKDLLEKLNVPIGLIATSWGGTAAEAWTPQQDLANDPALRDILKSKATASKRNEPHKDPGNIGFDKGWARADFDDSAWQSMELPAIWHERGLDMDGSVWFRRDIDVPADWAGKPLTLSAGVIDDFDFTYFNGVQVGATGMEQPSWWTYPRSYTVPGELVRAGRNTIAVRAFVQWNRGGLKGPADLMWIKREDGKGDAIPLSGAWRYQVELSLPAITSVNVVQPTSLYNGMIHPLVGLPIAGAIWYQGESNAARAHQYQNLLSTMIRAWRREWGQGDFPFLIVQLASYGQSDAVTRSPWAELRDAQRIVSQREPNCGIACAIDLGEPTDIHPRNKRDVGKRLALEAMRVAYGDAKAPRSPVYASHTVDANAVTIHFDHPGDGLTSDGPVTGCFIAGEDGVFHPANVGIVGHSIIARTKLVPKPVAVRYGWTADPGCNLKSRAGLPVLPFRTDDQPWVTRDAT
jgi:sialate O-acetylesterase